MGEGNSKLTAPATGSASSVFRDCQDAPAESESYPLNLAPLPLAIWGCGEAQLFCAFCARGALQRTLWDGNGGGD